MCKVLFSFGGGGGLRRVTLLIRYGSSTVRGFFNSYINRSFIVLAFKLDEQMACCVKLCNNLEILGCIAVAVIVHSILHCNDISVLISLSVDCYKLIAVAVNKGICIVLLLNLKHRVKLGICSAVKLVIVRVLNRLYIRRNHGRAVAAVNRHKRKRIACPVRKLKGVPFVLGEHINAYCVVIVLLDGYLLIKRSGLAL